ncbi:MAG: penicillin-binding transpeptidase domain-containing protein, partial [Planctomycetota bacterium]
LAVVMGIENGDVLALAGRPSFDPNLGVPLNRGLMRNRVLTDPVEPGSTFKPFVACGALQGKYVSKEELIDCHQGVYHVGSRIIKDTSPHGMMDLAGIMTHSSNIGMAIIGQRMGNTVAYNTVRQFGFGEVTGIDLPGEGVGKVHALRRWGSMSAASVSFGYEISVTPIQLVTAFCALINQGFAVRPHVAGELVGSDGMTTRLVSTSERSRQVVPSDIAKYVGRELLESVVQNGTGRKAQLDRYRVLGKTGTPKLAMLKSSKRKGYEEGAYAPAFLGAAPASDPRIAVLVMVRRPEAKRGYYGGVVAAPAAARILDVTLEYLGVPSDKNVVLTGL